MKLRSTNYTVTIGCDGKFFIPKYIRDALRMEQGTRLQVYTAVDGMIVLKKVMTHA